MKPPIGTKKLTDRQRELLAQVVAKENIANFDGPQIPDWKALKTVMVALGGKWKSRVGFEFPDDVYVHEVLRVARESGEILDPSAADFFETPPELAEQVCKWAKLDSHQANLSVLEPSAGHGALALMARDVYGCNVHCVEALEKNCKVLSSHGLSVSHRMFESCVDTIAGVNDGFDRVIMNPPFSGRADLAHVTHAMRFLKRGGILVAIMSAGVEFRDDAKARAFRELMATNAGELRRNPDGSFKRSGTMVRTVMVKMHKGG